MKKTVKKTTKKNVKPDVVLNLLDVETPNQLYNEAINAKVRAGKAITEEEFAYAKESVISDTVDKVADIAISTYLSIPHQTFEVNDGEKLVFDEHGNATIKKPNIFKRFWKWLRRK